MRRPFQRFGSKHHRACAQIRRLTGLASEAMWMSMKRCLLTSSSCRIDLALMASCPKPALLEYVLNNPSTSKALAVDRPSRRQVSQLLRGCPSPVHP